MDLIVLLQHLLLLPEIVLVLVVEHRSIHSQISIIMEPMKLALIRTVTLTKSVMAKKL